jgi:Mn-dependent DtxR family transcriptional regulator
LKQLKENNYVEVDEKNHITLTETGREIADEMYDRHTVLTKIFKHIGVPEEVAIEDACRVEHYISATTFRALKEHFEACTKGEE